MSATHSMFRIYSLIPFDRGAKARWILTEMGVPHETKWLDREKGENDAPEFLKLNPMGRVPVLQHGDVTMFESTAMCEYLADLFPEHKMAPELRSPQRAKYLQWMSFATDMLALIQSRIMVIEDIPEAGLRKEKEEALFADLDGALEALDVALADNSGYLVGGRFTAADVNVGYHLYWLTLWPELNAILEKHPKVSRYLQDLRKMPSAVKADVFSYVES